MGELQIDIHRLKNWADEWLLKLNVDKCWGTTYILNNSNMCDTKYYIETIILAVDRRSRDKHLYFARGRSGPYV